MHKQVPFHREVTNTNLQGDVPGPDGEAGTSAVTDSEILVDDNDASQPTGTELDPLNNLELRMMNWSPDSRSECRTTWNPLPTTPRRRQRSHWLDRTRAHITAVLRVEKQRAAIEELDRRTQSLLKDLRSEVQLEQEQILNKPSSTSRTSGDFPNHCHANTCSTDATDSQDHQRGFTSNTASCARPHSAEQICSINALNSGDRQQLRDAATAELNITSDQKGAGDGRAITTELEVVAGGGSYWLVMLQGEAWLPH